MPVAPRDAKSIGADQGDAYRLNGGGHSPRVEQGPPGHFFHTGRAGTRQPEFPGGKPALVTRLVPFNQEAVFPAIYGVWNQEIE